MIGVVVAGAMGRMGQIIARLCAEAPDIELRGLVDQPSHPAIGTQIHDVPLVGELKSVLRNADVLIDFSSPAASVVAAEACAHARVAAVFGTTGLDNAQQAAIAQASQDVPIVFAPNMSTGVNVTYRLVAEARRWLGSDYKPAIFEAHHRWKKDAPSGTALRLRELAGCESDDVVAIRGGDVVGEHTVFFLGDGERIEITHRATGREAFARGALRAARWVAGRPAGLYGMFDVLDLSSSR